MRRQARVVVMPHVLDWIATWRDTRWQGFVDRLDALAISLQQQDIEAIQAARRALNSKLINNRGDIPRPLTQLGGVAGAGGVPRVWLINDNSNFVLVHATYKQGEQAVQGSIREAAAWTRTYLNHPQAAVPFLAPRPALVQRVSTTPSAWLDHHRAATAGELQTALGIDARRADQEIRAWRAARGYGLWPNPARSNLPANWLPPELEVLRAALE